MNAPHLTRKLLLEAPERVADGAGGYVEGWLPLGVLWAEVLAGTGRDQAGFGTSVARVPYRITVRAAAVGSTARPTPDQRFRDGTRLFRVLAVSERDPQGRYLTCLTEEEALR
jgi:head-tail adaptor